MFIYFFTFPYICLVHGEKNTNKSIEKLPEHLLAEPHPSNLNLSSVYILHFNPRYAAGRLNEIIKLKFLFLKVLISKFADNNSVRYVCCRICEKVLVL